MGSMEDLGKGARSRKIARRSLRRSQDGKEIEEGGMMATKHEVSSWWKENRVVLKWLDFGGIYTRRSAILLLPASITEY